LGPRWSALADDWRAELGAVLAAAKLEPPAERAFRSTGKTGVHSEHLGYVLAEMQMLQRTYPGGVW
jgi:ring-1,2-phenylacetyl-CoA epoxidase subunit PaaC